MGGRRNGGRTGAGAIAVSGEECGKKSHAVHRRSARSAIGGAGMAVGCKREVRRSCVPRSLRALKFGHFSGLKARDMTAWGAAQTREAPGQCSQRILSALKARDIEL